MAATTAQDRIGVVVIGRNEGERLRRCLTSLTDVAVRVYVDSASSDDSVAWARGQSVHVIELVSPPKLTAARGRNAGLHYLTQAHPDLEYVQFVDGDCEVQPGWLATAVAALEADAGLGAVFGRRRERFPERSIYNALCDDEWNVPIGEALTCGGDVMCRVAAVSAIHGYDETMIAGEDPDMSTRLRKAGWRIRRVDADMTLHDAAILRFGQWWTRARRAGHAFAELASRHPDIERPTWRKNCKSSIAWALGLPGVTLALLLAALLLAWATGAWWLLLAPVALLLIWPLNMLRLAHRARRDGLAAPVARARGVLLMVAKFPQTLGILEFRGNRAKQRESRLIEYKS
jgi:GT2 family glycosyltransferase